MRENRKYGSVRGGGSNASRLLDKLLIDRGITKTEMRKRAGVSTSVLAKMGKNETVSMDTMAKIATSLECGFDDIVEIQNGVEKGGGRYGGKQ